MSHEIVNHILYSIFFTQNTTDTLILRAAHFRKPFSRNNLSEQNIQHAARREHDVVVVPLPKGCSQWVNQAGVQTLMVLVHQGSV